MGGVHQSERHGVCVCGASCDHSQPPEHYRGGKMRVGERGSDGCSGTLKQKKSGRSVLIHAADDDECFTVFSPHE